MRTQHGRGAGEIFLGAYGRGLSKAAGLRGLAKLSRWDDRSKIALSNTLLPYLTALVEDGELAPKDALALNRLADPVEYYNRGTKEFSQAIRDKSGPDPDVISELVQQFEDNNPGVQMDSTVEALASLAEEALGSSSETVRYLSAARKRYASVRDTRNDHMNYRGVQNFQMRKRADEITRSNHIAIDRIVAAADPADSTSLIQAISALNNLQNIYDLKGGFLASLRSKVPFGARAQYVRDICALEHFFFYWKLSELKECKRCWAGSSAALDEVYEEFSHPPDSPSCRRPCGS